MLTKQDQLFAFLQSILSHSEYGVQIGSISKKLDITEQDIVNEFFDYNLNVHDEKGNEIYKSLPNRFVLHIHNLIQGSWHLERQAVVMDFVKLAQPSTMADIGFGVPSEYTKKLILEQKLAKLTFFDLYNSAFIFAENLLNLWDKNWRKQIRLQKTDMDTLEFIGNFDLYLLQDAIEHTINPTAYLTKLVKLAPQQTRFIVSLPIGPIFPRHYMAWESDDIGIKWLQDCGLKIELQKNVYTKPEVDLFAEQIDPNYHDLYTFCSKK